MVKVSFMANVVDMSDLSPSVLIVLIMETHVLVMVYLFPFTSYSLCSFAVWVYFIDEFQTSCENQIW